MGAKAFIPATCSSEAFLGLKPKNKQTKTSKKPLSNITCDLYAVHINFQSHGRVICSDTQNQLIFYFLKCYHPGKIKGEDHNHTSNTK